MNAHRLLNRFQGRNESGKDVGGETSATRARARFRPQLEGFEARCLLTVGAATAGVAHVARAAVEPASAPTASPHYAVPTPTVEYGVVQFWNNSSYYVPIEFKWNSGSTPSQLTLAPHTGWYFWTYASSSLSPQVLFHTTTAANSLVDDSVGYNTYWGPLGSAPPFSSSRIYVLQNTSGGVNLFNLNGTPVSGGGFSGLGALRPYYSGSFQDTYENSDNGRYGYTQGTVQITIQSAVPTATGYAVTGVITVRDNEGVFTFSDNFSGSFSGNLLNPEKLDIGGNQNGVDFGFNFVLNPQGDLYADNADSGDGFYIYNYAAGYYDDNNLWNANTYAFLPPGS